MKTPPRSTPQSPEQGIALATGPFLTPLRYDDECKLEWETKSPVFYSFPPNDPLGMEVMFDLNVDLDDVSPEYCGEHLNDTDTPAKDER